MSKDRSYRIAIIGTAAVIICGGLAYFLAPRFGLPGLEKHHEGEQEPAPVTTEAVKTGVTNPSPLPSASPQPVASPTAEDRRKVQVLDEILKSKNDNDPRLDTELKDLSPAAKRLMREKYAEIAPEKRNERGTIVFLLGRNPTAEDFAFLKQVLSEQPCLGLEDCNKEMPAGSDTHSEMGLGVTLNYPQMMALYSAEQQIERAERGEQVSLDEVRATVDVGVNSQVREVASKATELRERLKNLKS